MRLIQLKTKHFSLFSRNCAILFSRITMNHDCIPFEIATFFFSNACIINLCIFFYDYIFFYSHLLSLFHQNNCNIAYFYFCQTNTTKSNEERETKLNPHNIIVILIHTFGKLLTLFYIYFFYFFVCFSSRQINHKFPNKLLFMFVTCANAHCIVNICDFISVLPVFLLSFFFPSNIPIQFFFHFVNLYNYCCCSAFVCFIVFKCIYSLNLSYKKHSFLLKLKYQVLFFPNKNYREYYSINCALEIFCVEL